MRPLTFNDDVIRRGIDFSKFAQPSWIRYIRSLHFSLQNVGIKKATKTGSKIAEPEKSPDEKFIP